MESINPALHHPQLTSVELRSFIQLIALNPVHQGPEVQAKDQMVKIINHKTVNSFQKYPFEQGPEQQTINTCQRPGQLAFGFGQ